MVDNNSQTAQPATLAEYLREQRLQLGLSQRQLASKANIHHSQLARLERGEISARPNPEKLQRLADALGVDSAKLLNYLGATPHAELPSVQAYFRRKLGVDADEAEVLANLISDYRRVHPDNPSHTKGETYEDHED